MKKYIIVLLVLLMSCLITISAQNEDMFINALRNCTPYNSSDEININGITATSVKQMQGWQGDKCYYKETVKLNGMDFTTSCKFTKEQIHEIVSVADAYFLTQKYSKEEIDLSSSDTVKNNPIVQVLNKYLQDSSVCSIQGLE